MLLLQIALSAAFAQDVTGGAAPPFNVQTLRPSGDSHEFFRVVDSDMPTERFSAFGMFQYAARPLEYTYFDGRTVSVAGDLLQLDGALNVRMRDLRVSLAVPVLLRSFGGEIPASSGVGDLSLDAKWRIRNAGEQGMGVAVVARRTFRTSTLPEGLSASQGNWDLVFAGDYRAKPNVGLSVNLGAANQPTVELEGATWGSYVYGQLGFDVKASEEIGFVGEVHVARVAASGTWRSEALIGANFRKGRGLVVRPGVAFALGDAVGTPIFRGILAFGYDPLPVNARVDTPVGSMTGPTQNIVSPVGIVATPVPRYPQQMTLPLLLRPQIPSVPEAR